MTLNELQELNIWCYNDTIAELIGDGIIHVEKYDKECQYVEEYYLADAARKMINKFVVANGEREKTNIYVDLPSCFVIMPFNEPWSNDV